VAVDETDSSLPKAREHPEVPKYEAEESGQRLPSLHGPKPYKISALIQLFRL